MNANQEVLIENKAIYLRQLYESYSGMLLGYIFEVVKDPKLAEKYLVEIFCDLSVHLDKKPDNENYNWSQLHRFAKNKLALLNNAHYIKPNALSAQGNHEKSDNALKNLTEEQRKVFREAYYHGKPIQTISSELNKPIDSIRKTLKEAFSVIRQGCGN